MILAIWLAGVLHLLIASSNFFAARMLDYRGNLACVSPIVREVFWVQNLFIELVLAGLALLCFFFAGDLAGGTSLGRACSGFLAGFWALRLVIQWFVYDADQRRKHRIIDVTFLLSQAYLVGVFAVAAWLAPPMAR